MDNKNMKEKEKKKEKEINKPKKKKQQKKKANNSNSNKRAKQENSMINDLLVTLLYMEKHAVYFEFLKRFIDIPFVKTVRRICF